MPRSGWKGPRSSRLRAENATKRPDGIEPRQSRKFPDAHITAVLQNGSEIRAHGSVEMPVWGPILGKMNQANPQDRMLRVSNLSRFLDNMQVK